MVVSLPAIVCLERYDLQKIVCQIPLLQVRPVGGFVLYIASSDTIDV